MTGYKNSTITRKNHTQSRQEQDQLQKRPYCDNNDNYYFFTFSFNLLQTQHTY